ncbi:response regulator transcription factor [Bacillus sp. FJAT-45037]|uniref:response regulator transcription factor n=1 Tax=Bacillus sp. FJAT-45037 TaxID=2011007 RepID=UPI000C245C67
MTTTILVVEDEQTMQLLLSIHLTKENYQVLVANNGAEALSLLPQYQLDLAIVDVMMPVMDGFEFIDQLRKTSDLPVIFLTARSDEVDRIKGLKLGGDDYLIKPFSKGELLARIEAVLRRTKSTLSLSKKRFSHHGLVIDPQSRQAHLHQTPIHLTVKEFDLVLFLIEHRGQAFSREHLLTSIWGFDYDGTERTVDTHIKTIRMKLKPYDSLIQTVWGIGYKMVDET